MTYRWERRRNGLIGMLLLLLLLGSAVAPVHAARPAITLRGVTWEDSNCDGMRAAGEPLGSVRVMLFAAGADGTVGTPDDQVIQGGGAVGGYFFTLGQTELGYRLVVLPRDVPPGYRPAPYQQGDNRAIDSDFTRPNPAFTTWASGAFQFDPDTTVTGIDLGICTHRTFLPGVQR